MTLPVWKSDDAEFPARFSGLLRKLREGLLAAGSAGPEPPDESVRRIVEDVRERGDAALLEYTERFDGCRLTPQQLRVRPEELEAALERCPSSLLEALQLAAGRIRAFQQSILQRDPEPTSVGGRTIGVRYRPVDSAGLCVPGATASLASTVLMAGVPAQVAGVARLVMVTAPQPDGSVSDERLAAADIAGVNEVYRVGGAQAVAALAFGTESIPAVDFIAGPGNIFVTLAKKHVFGQVGIEMLPGPSEVVVVADASAPPEFVAADLISQAEHNPGSAILLTDSGQLTEAVQEALRSQLSDLPRGDVTRKCLADYGALILARSIEECVELANRIAPEHLELMLSEPEPALAAVRHAGAIFVGPWTPEPVGDYVAGPSHILPTGTTARFASGLSANDFLKRSSVIRYERSALEADADAVTRMARAEGLDGHARAVERRTGRELDPRQP
ncbi:MAG: histidinol dehydrogenase [Planctomycetota bacterium]